jgi:hypothetical protein
MNDLSKQLNALQTLKAWLTDLEEHVEVKTECRTECGEDLLSIYAREKGTKYWVRIGCIDRDYAGVVLYTGSDFGEKVSARSAFVARAKAALKMQTQISTAEQIKSDLSNHVDFEERGKLLQNLSDVFIDKLLVEPEVKFGTAELLFTPKKGVGVLVTVDPELVVFVNGERIGEGATALHKLRLEHQTKAKNE